MNFKFKANFSDLIKLIFCIFRKVLIKSICKWAIISSRKLIIKFFLAFVIFPKHVYFNDVIRDFISIIDADNPKSSCDVAQFPQKIADMSLHKSPSSYYSHNAGKKGKLWNSWRFILFFRPFHLPLRHCKKLFSETNRLTRLFYGKFCDDFQRETDFISEIKNEFLLTKNKNNRYF